MPVPSGNFTPFYGGKILNSWQNIINGIFSFWGWQSLKVPSLERLSDWCEKPLRIFIKYSFMWLWIVYLITRPLFQTFISVKHLKSVFLFNFFTIEKITWSVPNCHFHLLLILLDKLFNFIEPCRIVNLQWRDVRGPATLGRTSIKHYISYHNSPPSSLLPWTFHCIQDTCVLYIRDTKSLRNEKWWYVSMNVAETISESECLEHATPLKARGEDIWVSRDIWLLTEISVDNPCHIDRKAGHVLQFYANIRRERARQSSSIFNK